MRYISNIFTELLFNIYINCCCYWCSLSRSLSCVKFNASQHLQTIHNAALIVPGDVNEMHKLHTLHIFYFIFRWKKQRLLIAQSTRSVILCALYIVYIIRYWHLSGHLTLHAAQCKHFKCQFMQLFCPAIDENQFAQAAKRK